LDVCLLGSPGMSDDLINWLWREAKKADSREDHDHLLGAAQEINRLTRELEASSRPSLIPTAHQLLSDEIDRLRIKLSEDDELLTELRVALTLCRGETDQFQIELKQAVVALRLLEAENAEATSLIADVLRRYRTEPNGDVYSGGVPLFGDLMCYVAARGLLEITAAEGHIGKFISGRWVEVDGIDPIQFRARSRA